jgi:hypothetical protein
MFNFLRMPRPAQISAESDIQFADVEGKRRGTRGRGDIGRLSNDEVGEACAVYGGPRIIAGMADETLTLLATEVRGKTLRLLEGITEDMARFAAPGLNNSILWHAGHSLLVVEHLSVMPATGQSAGYPEDWFNKFSWKSMPSAVTSWPPLADVIDALRNQLQGLTTAIAVIPPERLDQIVDPAKKRTLRYSILHGLHDEAGHQGEIWLLRKMFGKQNAAATSTGS